MIFFFSNFKYVILSQRQKRIQLKRWVKQFIFKFKYSSLVSLSPSPPYSSLSNSFHYQYTCTFYDLIRQQLSFNQLVSSIDYKIADTNVMFFHRNTRIQTETRISRVLETETRESNQRLKIKNIRFSLDQEIDNPIMKTEQLKLSVSKESEFVKSTCGRRINFLAKLPELSAENKQTEKQLKTGLKQVTLQHKKKDRLLSSILQILKPNYAQQSQTQKQHSKHIRQKDYKIQTANRQYINQFFDELPQYSSTKHYRAPKILQNQLMKYKNSNNIVRRKIFSEDKSRQKGQKDEEECKKPEGDLQKIEIVTFSNKFPIFKKDPSIIKDCQK